MTEYWKSQGNHFCKYCKCWISDNKMSRAIHEQGVRHKEAVEEKLSEIRRKQAAEVKVAKDETHFLKKMEEAALRDYKKKDIKENRDFTAKLYNNEDLPDVDEKYENIRQANVQGPRLPGEAEPKQAKFEHMLKAGEALAASKGEDRFIAPVKANASGTKWHNPAPPKLWYEAKTDDDTLYYWNTKSKESRWDPPPGGYVTIAEQEEEAAKKEKTGSKRKRMEAHRKKMAAEPVVEEAKPEPKADRYGGGGWKTIETVAPAPKVDLGLPAQSEGRLQPVIQAVSDRQYTFKEKTIGSLGGETVVGAKPVINFRKRKNQSIRQREDD